MNGDSVREVVLYADEMFLHHPAIELLRITRPFHEHAIFVFFQYFFDTIHAVGFIDFLQFLTIETTTNRIAGKVFQHEGHRRRSLHSFHSEDFFRPARFVAFGKRSSRFAYANRIARLQIVFFIDRWSFAAVQSSPNQTVVLALTWTGAMPMLRWKVRL